MVVNGYTKLVCKTPIAAELQRGRDELRITPMRTMPVIKDLVVDMAPFWKHFRDVEPWLQPDPNAGAAGKIEEYRGAAAATGALAQGSQLHPVRGLLLGLRRDRGRQPFAGPPALAKAHRFVTDPRDSKRKERLQKLVDLGLWDCAHAYNCMECPKHVNPAHAIADLRRISIQAGMTSNIGARHSHGVHQERGPQRPPRRNGAGARDHRLSPTSLARSEVGPQGVRMLLKGKMPLPIFHKKVDNSDEVKKIYDACRTPEA